MKTATLQNHLPAIVLFLFLGLSLGWMENAYLSPPDSASYYSVARSLILDRDINFLNEYQAFRFEPNMFYLTKNDTLSNDWPIGSGMFWVSFLAIAHGVASGSELLGIHNPSVRADGYSALYRVFAVGGILICAIAGLLVGWSAAARRYGAWAALAGVVMLLLGTPFGFYFYYYVFMAHITSFFAVTLFCALWMRKVGQRRSIWEWSALGILAGWMTMVRPQNAVVMVVLLVEAYDVASSAPRDVRWVKVRRYLMGMLTVGIFALLAFLPQILFWWRLYGNPLQMPKMEEMNWLAPRIDLMLFSTYHGLLSWSPVLVLVIPGLWLLYKQNRVVGGGFVLVLLLQTYINGTNEIWWAGGSFGNRRFVDYSFIFIMAFGACCGRWGRRPWFVLFAVCATLWNFCLMAAERAQVLTLDRHVSWTSAFFRGVLNLLLSPHHLLRALHGDFASATTIWRILAMGIILLASVGSYFLLSSLRKSKQARGFIFLGALALMVAFDVLMGVAVLRTSKIEMNGPETRSFAQALYNPEYGEVISRKNRLLWNNYYEAGFYYLTKENFGASEKYYEKARDLLPAHPSAYRYLGLIHLEEGDLPLARRNLEKALSVRPGYESAARSLAEVYERILRNDSYNQEVAEKFARLLAREKQYDSALQVAKYNLQLNPDNAESLRLVREIEQTAEREKRRQ